MSETSSRIVFAHDSRLNFISPSGRDLGRSRSLGGFITDLSVSDNGRYMAVLRHGGTAGAHGEYYSAFVRAAGERELRRIAIGGPIPTDAAPSIAISPDGRLLAISIGQAIRIVNLDTGHRRILRRTAGFDFQASFFGDGRHLVFSHSGCCPRGNADVFTIALDGGPAHALIHSRREELFPKISADGRYLAFMRRSGGGFELVTERIGSGREQVIRRVQNLFSRPDFSPNGRRMVFAWTKRFGYRPLPPFTIFTVGVDGREAQVVARGIRGGMFLPQWTQVPRDSTRPARP